MTEVAFILLNGMCGIWWSSAENIKNNLQKAAGTLYESHHRKFQIKYLSNRLCPNGRSLNDTGQGEAHYIISH